MSSEPGGMRRRSEQQPRNQAVTVKLSSPEKTAIQSAAARRHLSVGAYIAEVALAAAEGRTVPVNDTERELLRELMPIGAFLEGCFSQLYEAMKRQEATGVPDPDLKSTLARVEQSCDKANDVTLKVARLLPSLHRERLRTPASPSRASRKVPCAGRSRGTAGALRMPCAYLGTG
jgi:hypothetical protein